MKRTFSLVSRGAVVAVMIAALSPLSLAAEKKPVEVRKNDKCQVCGMLVAGFPTWISQVVFNDGTYALFDGPKDMFRYYFNIGKYNPAKKIADIGAIYVTEYYSTKYMDARKAFFVQGSNVDGPMGVELVPIESLGKAKEFMKDHKGKKILRFDEVKREDLK